MSLRVKKLKGVRNLVISGTVRGIRCKETAGTPDRALAEMYRAKREAELYEESLFGARATVSFAAAALSYLDFEPRSAGTKFRVGRLVAHFGGRLVGSIGQPEADKAVGAILGASAAPAGKVRGVYTPLSAILNHAAERGYRDPVRFKKPAPPKGKTRWLTPAEALRLLDAAAPHLRPLLHFILCTGARLSEALYLDWADVDLAAARAIFRDTKSGRDRVAALPEAAVVTLANLPMGVTAEAGGSSDAANDLPSYSGRSADPRPRQGRVFRTDDGSPYHDTGKKYGGQIKTGFRAACRRAQIREMFPHALRHTWASFAYAVTKDLLLLKDEGGWATVALVERYAHLVPSEMVGEIGKIWGRSHPRFGVLPTAAAKITEARTA